MEEDEERPCYDRGNGSPYCSPIPTDTWKNGTQHQFVWNYKQEYLSLYLYYKENYAYQPVKNWTSIRRADGALAVQVDNSWFPPNTTRTSVYGYYLPAGMNPLKELSNPESQYPHPFNFTIERPQLPSLDDSPGSGGGGNHSPLPGWAIALITVFSIGAAAALAAFLLLCCIRRRRRDQQQLHHHDIYDPYQHDEHQQQQQPVMRGVSTTTDTGSSIYSTTPMMHATFSAPRLSSGNYSSRRSSNAMAPPNTAAILNNRSAVSHSTSSFITDAPAPSTASSSRLADSTFMWMVDSSSSQEHTTTTEEQRRRQLGEALLAQQLSEEEGASVKHAEKRPITVNGIRSEESRAVLEER
ncbi:hypothetical protein RO3G_17054 [Lichtheimia corymbifera JMRC:FSU:9682]|uniref:Uncharacterized protein n=1 Tax=Lichtheimia corymbifera JMRC:FSU:9682 TaxID=1263082 RepID=A0A068RG75_9FUNG|nr:hypothetical protein RO3G_17054 [Lichtheimia corymbifera JMRC:FSU:9682]